MAAHAKPGDSPVAAIGQGRVVGIDPGNELFADEGLVAYGRVDGAIEIPAVKAAVGTDEKDAELVGFVRKLRRGHDPLGVVACPSVQEVDRGEAGWAGFFGIGSNDDAADILIHGGAVYGDSVDPGGEAG